MANFRFTVPPLARLSSVTSTRRPAVSPSDVAMGAGPPAAATGAAVAVTGTGVGAEAAGAWMPVTEDALGFGAGGGSPAVQPMVARRTTPGQTRAFGVMG